MWGVSLPDFGDLQKLGSQLGEALVTAKHELDKNLDQLATSARENAEGGGDELLLSGVFFFLLRAAVRVRPRAARLGADGSRPNECISTLPQSRRCSRPRPRSRRARRSRASQSLPR